MEKLSTANPSGEKPTASALAAVAPAIGMAALWLSVFKQLLYPMLFAYYRTGDEGALVAQWAYAVALVAVVFALLVTHERLGGLIGTWRWVVAALGVGGALGIALRTPVGPLPEGDLVVMCVGGVLSAAYVPVHFAFWALYARRAEHVDVVRTVAVSFGVFLAVFGLLTVVGANSVYVSIACPVVSAAMALACPRLDGTPEVEAAAEPEPVAEPSQPTLPAGFAETFDLSEREAELATYAHRSWSAKRIAAELFIAESTVYTHLKRIYRKTDVHSKSELIALIDSWKT